MGDLQVRFEAQADLGMFRLRWSRGLRTLGWSNGSLRLEAVTYAPCPAYHHRTATLFVTNH